MRQHIFGPSKIKAKVHMDSKTNALPARYTICNKIERRMQESLNLNTKAEILEV